MLNYHVINYLEVLFNCFINLIFFLSLENYLEVYWTKSPYKLPFLLKEELFVSNTYYFV